MTEDTEAGIAEPTASHNAVVVDFRNVANADERIRVRVDAEQRTASIEAAPAEVETLELVGCDTSTHHGTTSAIVRFNDGAGETELVVAATWSFRPGSGHPMVTGRALVLGATSTATYAVVPFDVPATSPPPAAGPTAPTSDETETVGATTLRHAAERAVRAARRGASALAPKAARVAGRLLTRLRSNHHNPTEPPHPR